MYRVSSDIVLGMFTNVHLKETRTGLDRICPGKYIACVWDKWYVGVVLDKTNATGDLIIKCI